MLYNPMMAGKVRAMHVVTTRRRRKGRTYCAHLLMRSYREGGKVRKETLANLSHLPAGAVEGIRAALRGEGPAPAVGGMGIERSLPHGHVAAVLGAMRRLGLARALHARASAVRSAALALVASRVLSPQSKLGTARTLNGSSATSTLGAELGLGEATAEDLYAAMDWLADRQGAIEAALAKRHLSDGTLVLYDVSSSYLEGRCCELARRGYSRDGRKGTLQIVYGLLCSGDGCPVAIEVFEGNTADAMTLGAQIAKVRRRFGLRRVVFVGDRGVLTSARIDEEMRPVGGLDWITALRSVQIRALVERGPLQASLFDTADLAEIRHPDYPGERLVACLNPLLRDERRRRRDELLRATEQELEKVAAAVRRRRAPLRGADRIGLRVGRVIARYRMAKHFVLDIAADAFGYRRDHAAVKAEERLDGIYVIRTSLPAESLDAERAVRAYKSLAAVERAFRSIKTVDLHIRPLHHRLARRVRAHVLICMLAYYVEWHLLRAWKPLLFHDEADPDDPGRRPPSPVAPAKRSPDADRKAAARLSADGLPLHHFRGLLEHLATQTRNTVRIDQHAPPVQILADPTDLQRAAYVRLDAM